MAVVRITLLQPEPGWGTSNMLHISGYMVVAKEVLQMSLYVSAVDTYVVLIDNNARPSSHVPRCQRDAKERVSSRLLSPFLQLNFCGMRCRLCRWTFIFFKISILENKKMFSDHSVKIKIMLKDASVKTLYAIINQTQITCSTRKMLKYTT